MSRVKRILLAISILLFSLLVMSEHSRAASYTYPPSYQIPDNCSQLITVCYKKKSNATLTFYQKDLQGIFCKKLSCAAYVGKKGIYKVREGDKRTPLGLYSLDQAFGICKNPGTLMPYKQLDLNDYWCSDSNALSYNKMVTRAELDHRCRGERLAGYRGSYDYAIAIGYNKEGIPGKGSAIFLHCSKKKYTSGCISVKKSKMKKILRYLNPTANPMILIDKW